MASCCLLKISCHLVSFPGNGATKSRESLGKGNALLPFCDKHKRRSHGENRSNVGVDLVRFKPTFFKVYGKSHAGLVIGIIQYG